MATTLTDEFCREYLPERGWLREHVEWAATTTHAPPIFHVVTGLAFAALELARAGWILADHAKEAPQLWFVEVAGSGMGKGASLSRIEAIQDVLYQTLPLEAQPSMNPRLAVRGSAEGTFAALEQRRLEGPFGPRTPALLINEEFSEVLDLTLRTPAFLSQMLELHDQKTMSLLLRVIQRGDEDRSGTIVNPAVSTVFVSTLDQMTDVFVRKHVYGGFASRFLWFNPKDWNVFWAREPPWRNSAAMMKVVARISSWIQAINFRSPDYRGIFVACDPEVAETHTRWADGLHRQYPNGHQQRHLFVPRMTNTAQVIAGVVAAIEAAEDNNFSSVAVRMSHYQYARRLCDLASQSGELILSLINPEELQRENKFLQHVQSLGRRGIRTQDAVEHLKMTRRGAISALQSFAETGELVDLIVKRPGQTGRPSRFWWVPEFAPPAKLITHEASGRVIFWADYMRFLNEATPGTPTPLEDR